MIKGNHRIIAVAASGKEAGSIWEKIPGFGKWLDFPKVAKWWLRALPAVSLIDSEKVKREYGIGKTERIAPRFKAWSNRYGIHWINTS